MRQQQQHGGKARRKCQLPLGQQRVQRVCGVCGITQAHTDPAAPNGRPHTLELSYRSTTTTTSHTHTYLPRGRE